MYDVITFRTILERRRIALFSPFLLIITISFVNRFLHYVILILLTFFFIFYFPSRPLFSVVLSLYTSLSTSFCSSFFLLIFSFLLILLSFFLLLFPFITFLYLILCCYPQSCVCVYRCTYMIHTHV